MIVADTSGLLALFNAREPKHEAVRQLVEMEEEPLAVSPFVVAELDYLAATRLGIDAELDILGELGGGAYELAAIDAGGLSACAAVVERYKDQDIGVADASLVVLAARYRTSSILTLDHRHFDVLRTLDGGRFTLLP
jgi:uncharacterized protein